jgi:hypothetical protein
LSLRLFLDSSRALYKLLSIFNAPISNDSTKKAKVQETSYKSFSYAAMIFFKLSAESERNFCSVSFN